MRDMAAPESMTQQRNFDQILASTPVFDSTKKDDFLSGLKVWNLKVCKVGAIYVMNLKEMQKVMSIYAL